REGDAVHYRIETPMRPHGFGQTRDVFVFGDVAIENGSGAHVFTELFRGFLLAIALVGEEDPGALAMERLGNRVGEAPAVGYPQDEGRSSFKKLCGQTAIVPAGTEAMPSLLSSRARHGDL